MDRRDERDGKMEEIYDHLHEAYSQPTRDSDLSTSSTRHDLESSTLPVFTNSKYRFLSSIHIYPHPSFIETLLYIFSNTYACNSYISFFHIVLGNPQPKRLPVVALHQKDPASANQVFSFPSLLHAGKLSDQVVNLMSVVVNTISKHLYQCKGKRAGTRFCLLG